MRLFISYSSVDRHAVHELVKVLDSAGHEAWFDLWLLPGQNWRQQTISAIEKSEAFVYVLTPESVESEWCRWEFSTAIEQGKPIVPVLLHPKTKFPDELNSHPYVDFTDGPTPEAVARLLSGLLRQDVVLQPEGASTDATESRAAAPTPGEARPRNVDYRATAVVAVLGLLLAVTALVLGMATGALADLGLTAQTGLLRLPAVLFRLGPAGVFVTAAVIFTVLRRQIVAVGGLFLLELALLAGYFSLQGEGVSFLQYLLLAALLLLGYSVGRTRLLLWPWLSFRLARALRRLPQLSERVEAVEDWAAPLLALLDQPILVPPYGTRAAMEALAAHGFSLAAFRERTGLRARQEQYRQIMQAIKVEEVRRADSLEAVLEVAELDELVANGQPIKAALQKIQSSDSEPEQVRACAQLLRRLEGGGSPSSRMGGLHLGQRKEALRHISQLVRRAIDPAKVARYWDLYGQLEAIAAQLPVAVPAPQEDAVLRQAIQNGLQQVTSVLEEVRRIEPELPQLSPRERKWYRALMETGLINDQLLATDYKERQILLGREIGRLQIMDGKQPATWLAISRDGQHVVEQSNPWHAITQCLIEHLEAIQQLDTRYVASAARELSRVLEGIDSIEAIAELEQRLAHLTRDGDSFSPMVEDTIQALLAIGNDTRAALDLMEGTYHRRQTLMDALDKSNQLRSGLQTRYVSPEPRQWAESVQRISTILDDYLNQQQEVERTAYRNPYIVGNPIQPRQAALFKGRIDLAQEIVDKLRGDNRPTIVLYGPRRMGKTSFLLQLQNLLRGRGNYIPVFFNAQEPGTRQSDASFFYSLARAIYVQMRSRARGQRIRPPELAEFEAYPYTTINAWLENEIVPLLDQQVLLVTIDEFETIGKAIRQGELTQKVLDYLRHTMQHSDSLLFLFCGVETLEALGPNAESYFIGAQAIEISYLSEAEAEELIRYPNPDAGEMPEYDDDVVDEILYLTHRQPFLIQAVCSRIVDLANSRNLRRIDKSVLDEALPEVFRTSRLFFMQIWNDAGEEGQRILATLAHGPASLEPEQASSAAVRALVRRHVIHQRPDGRYEIEIPLVRGWIADQV